MSRFMKLSQTLWHCQYHIVWVPKYRFMGSVFYCVFPTIKQQIFQVKESLNVVLANIANSHAVPAGRLVSHGIIAISADIDP